MADQLVELRGRNDRLLIAMFNAIDGLETAMTSAEQHQAQIDAAVAALGESLTAIETEIATLKTQSGAEDLDFSGLDSAVARAHTDETL